ncbi:MAG TPA: CPBP family intramembrane glutamic endopeptidase [Gemmatimonadaceae bacterium]|nr:CPBP family intramembrane glutamic endopeptidase [Gemmatimonadaceae bacterium]
MHEPQVGSNRSRIFAVAIAVLAIAAVATALWLFPRALPVIELEQKVTRDVALARADSFFRAHDLAPARARTAVRFQGNDSLTTFIGLAGGGHDSLNALVRGQDVAPFTWSVRAFVPGNPREARVRFAPDGRILGFSRTFAEADRRPEISADSGRVLAEHVLATWINERMDRWKFVASSYETKKTSGRIDRSYTFERIDRKLTGAPIRVEVAIAGDTPSRVRPFVEIPESFRRRYGEMRSANDFLALLAGVGILAIVIVGIVFLNRTARARQVRWHPALVAGGVVGALIFAAGLNELPGSWYGYDTATSPVAFQAMIVIGAIAIGAFTTLMVGFTLTAAEAATRQAFPQHLDWWKLWRFRGTREVATRVAGGYATACFAFAYVTLFYLATRTLLGWWVPSALLDDPNQIASPMPWISGIAASLSAGVWEEALFRALPLSLFSLWVGQRAGRRWWMTGAVVLTAIVFGFAHSNYPSWPPYSRGVEIFLDACLWAVLFLSFGLLVTVIAHFVYDVVLFGLFAASGTAIEYRISAAIIGLALLSPAIAVAWQWVRQRGFVALPEDARFGAWTPTVEEETAVAPAPLKEHTLTRRATRLAMVAVIIGVIVAIARPPQPTLGPQFTADRARVVREADSVLRARGVDPAGWRRLTHTGTDTLAAWPRFLREYKLIPRAQELAATYEPPATWVVRYVHTDGATVEQRTEEWRVRVWPDGRPLDVRHIIPDSARRNVAAPADVRRIALAALAREGVNTAPLRETEFKETARPSRKDVTVTYTDTAVKLAAGAAAKASVQIAGDEPLVAQRRMELPEAFLRADRQRQANRTIIGGLLGLLLVGGVMTGAIIVARRRPVIDDGVLDRRKTLMLVGAVTALSLIDGLNGLPPTLSSYDTSEPWSRFIGSTAVGFVGAPATALLVLGVWVALDALRRRVGIPMLRDAESGTASRGMLVAGLGLGAMVFAIVRLESLVPLGTVARIPPVPSTLLDLALPWLGEAPSVPVSAIMTVAVVGIPILVLAGITRRWALRALIAAVALALVAATAIAFAPPGEADPVRIILAVVRMGVIALALYFWGTLSAWSWLVAALVFSALGGLRSAVYAPTGQEQVAGALTLLVASVLIAIIVRHTRAEARRAPA